jgi:putative endonuclease
MEAHNIAVGVRGESIAEHWLTDLGYRVLERNWRCRHGEVDIVAVDGDTIVFVEVKTRTGTGYGHPFEAVTRTKLARLRRLAAAWHDAHPGAWYRAVRIDVVGVVLGRSGEPTVEHIVGCA